MSSLPIIRPIVNNAQLVRMSNFHSITNQEAIEPVILL